MNSEFGEERKITSMSITGVRVVGRGSALSLLNSWLFTPLSISLQKLQLMSMSSAERVAAADETAEDTSSNTPSLLQPRVVIYDGVCNLCHRGVKWLINVDKYEKIKFCCLQSRAAEPYMMVCGVEREDVSRRFLFIEGLGSYHQGSTAALRVLSYLPLPYSALSSLSVIPIPIRDAVYDYIAKRRYDWFGKVDSCLVLQEKEMLGRFIDRDELLGHKTSDW